MMAVSRRTAIKALLTGGLGAGVGLGAHGFLYERHALRIERPTLGVAGLPPALDGLRIGFLTDLHHSSFVSQAEIARAVDLVVDQRPDLIVLGGDYVSNGDRSFMRPCAEALAALSAPHGVFAILGNHDDEREMPVALSDQGFSVLRDARTDLTIRGERLNLAGIRFWTRQPSEIARVLRGSTATTILVAHDPRRLLQASALAVPAMLAGHTHGGQIVLPGLGAMAARKFPVVAGLGERGGTNVFVSRGVGTVYLPVRVNCPPDVAIVTLTRRVSSESRREQEAALTAS